MTSPAPQPATVAADSAVWRVGYRPDPWAWPSWQFASNGRFTGRWDDAQGTFRTIYAGTRLLSCLLEVLACFRPDSELIARMNDIMDNDGDLDATRPAGVVPLSWLAPRMAASAGLSGTYLAITQTETVAAMRPHFLRRAQELGLGDFDAAALKDAKPRQLTQEVATYIYRTTDLHGVQFLSRHGDDHTLWAIFERPGDPDVSPQLHQPTQHALQPNIPDMQEAFRIHRLRWDGY